MKNCLNSNNCTHRFSTLALAFSALLSYVMPATIYAESSEAVKYEFFMGIDVSVPYQGSSLPMVDYQDDKAVLWKKGKALPVGLSDVRVFNFFHTPKLSQNSVGISDFSAETVIGQMMNQSAQMIEMRKIQDMSSDLETASKYYKFVVNQPDSDRFASMSKMGNVSTGLEKSQSGLGNTTTNSFYANAYSIGQNIDPSNDTSMDGMPDTIEINFSISSQKSIKNAYAVIIGLIQKNAADTEQMQWIQFEELGSIGTVPKKVHIRQTGMPKGFVILDTNVCVYSHGEELASTMSEKRIEVSPEEARLMINTYYIEAHQGQTLPPSLATASISDHVVSALRSAGVTQDVVLHLDADANVLAAESAGKPVSGEALSLLQTLVFHPGLKDGEPVASAVQFDAAKFSVSSLGLMASD